MQQKILKLNILDLLLLCFGAIAVCNFFLISTNKINFIEIGKWSSLFLCYYITRKIRQKQWILWGIILFATTESILGICQKLHWQESHHSIFDITGTYSNPAPLGGILAISITIAFGFFYLYRTHRIIKPIILTTLCLLILALFFSESRAGGLAALAGCGFTRYIVKKKIKLHFLLHTIVALLICAICIGAYYYKKDSADGRLLIWRVTANMIADAPIKGHGIRAFNQKYMYYQAHYFENHPSSKYKELADNVAYPYNELLHLLVEMGIIGVLPILFLIIAICKYVSFQKENTAYIGAFLTLLTFSMFSYPSYILSLLLLYPLLLGGIICNKTMHISIPIKFIYIEKGIIYFSLFCLIKGACEYKLLEIHIKNLFTGSTSKIQLATNYIQNNAKELESTPRFLDLYAQYSFQHSSRSESLAILQNAKNIIPTSELLSDLGDLYSIHQNQEKALKCYKISSNMIPDRISPKYKLFKWYHNQKDSLQAQKIGLQIISQKTKIESTRVFEIKREVKKYFRQNSHILYF